MNSLFHSARVIYALLQRDFLVLQKNIKDDVINAVVRITAIYLGIGLVGHLLGFEPSIASDVVTGSMISVAISRCFSSAAFDSFDMEFARFIDYKRLLPLTARGLLVSYILNYMLIMIASALPLLIMLKLVLGDQMRLVTANWPAFLITFVLSSMLISCFFLTEICLVSFNWFRFNTWQRIFIPLNSFGCIMYAWFKVYGFSPMIARIMLINPVVFMVESIRATLIVKGTYIPVWYCAGGLAIWCMVFFLILFGPIARRIEEGRV